MAALRRMQSLGAVFHSGADTLDIPHHAIKIGSPILIALSQERGGSAKEGKSMEPPFEEHADISKLKEAAAILRLARPDLAVEIERAIDDLEELRPPAVDRQSHHP